MKYFVGYCTVEVHYNANNLNFSMIVMYPTESSEKIEPYSMNLAIDAIPKDEKFPLIIISHGDGGSIYTITGPSRI